MNKTRQRATRRPAVCFPLILFTALVVIIAGIHSAPAYAADCVLETGCVASADPGITIAMEDGSTFTVDSGATLNLIGTSGNEITVTHDSAGTYTFTINGTGGGSMLTVENTQDFRTGQLGTIDNTSWGSGLTLKRVSLALNPHPDL